MESEDRAITLLRIIYANGGRTDDTAISRKFVLSLPYLKRDLRPLSDCIGRGWVFEKDGYFMITDIGLTTIGGTRDYE